VALESGGKFALIVVGIVVEGTVFCRGISSERAAKETARNVCRVVSLECLPFRGASAGEKGLKFWVGVGMRIHVLFAALDTSIGVKVRLEPTS